MTSFPILESKTPITAIIVALLIGVFVFIILRMTQLNKTPKENFKIVRSDILGNLVEKMRQTYKKSDFIRLG